MTQWIEPYAKRWPQSHPVQETPLFSADISRMTHNNVASRFPQYSKPQQAASPIPVQQQSPLFAEGMQSQRDPRDYLPQPMNVGGPQQAQPQGREPASYPRASEAAGSNYPRASDATPANYPRGPGQVQWGPEGQITWGNGDKQQLFGNR
jgi:hypothetical protein